MTKNDSSLRYVGSPYQTSLSEAGQDKFLYCMSVKPAAGRANDTTAAMNSSDNSSTSSGKLIWKEDKRWVIDIGKKYIKATSAQDPSVLAARAGDRVVIPVRVGEDYEAEALGTRLRERGVEVELRHEKNALPSSGGAALAGSSTTASGDGAASAVDFCTPPEEADPLRVFADYMGGIDISALMDNSTTAADSAAGKTSKKGTAGGKADALSDAARAALHSAVLEEGKATIERLTSSEALASNQLGDSVQHSGRLFNLKLDRLRLKDFGPYGGAPVDYPLSDRGLVLIRGQSTDGTGADSNGSGKVSAERMTHRISCIKCCPSTWCRRPWP